MLLIQDPYLSWWALLQVLTQRMDGPAWEVELLPPLLILPILARIFKRKHPPMAGPVASQAPPKATPTVSSDPVAPSPGPAPNRMMVRGRFVLPPRTTMEGDIKASEFVELGEQAHVKGDVISDGDVVVQDGARVEGMIVCRGSVTLGRNASALAVVAKKGALLSEGAEVSRRMIAGGAIRVRSLEPRTEGPIPSIFPANPPAPARPEPREVVEVRRVASIDTPPLPTASPSFAPAVSEEPASPPATPRIRFPTMPAPRPVQPASGEVASAAAMSEPFAQVPPAPSKPFTIPMPRAAPRAPSKLSSAEREGEGQGPTVRMVLKFPEVQRKPIPKP